MLFGFIVSILSHLKSALLLQKLLADNIINFWSAYSLIVFAYKIKSMFALIAFRNLFTHKISECGRIYRKRFRPP